jgi:hypothetical protein
VEVLPPVPHTHPHRPRLANRNHRRGADLDLFVENVDRESHVETAPQRMRGVDHRTGADRFTMVL